MITTESFNEETFLNDLTSATGQALISKICDAETIRFQPAQRERLAITLWNFILGHRDNVRADVLVAVGAAIRKYVAMLSNDRIGEITTLLETGHRAMLPLDLELEVVKMVYRKFEANPPAKADPQPELAERLWEMAQDYMRPRIILRDKHATVASLSIEAIVAMRSQFAKEAVAAALRSPFPWFGEMVADNLKRLLGRWQTKDSQAADWCARLLQEALDFQVGNLSASHASR